MSTQLEFVTLGYCKNAEECKEYFRRVIPGAVFDELYDEVHGVRVMVYAPKNSKNQTIPPITVVA